MDNESEQPQTIHKGANIPGRRVLGRGLSSLMQSARIAVDTNASQKKHATLQRTNEETNETSEPLTAEVGAGHAGLAFIPIDRVFPNASQPRQNFSEAELESLSQSIRDTGLLQPIIVRRKTGFGIPAGTFEIVAGERRFRSAKRAGLEKIPAIIRQLSDQDSFQLALIENVQRSDLDPIEEAEAYRKLVDDYQLSHSEVAKIVSKDRVSIANTIRLLKLAPEVKQLIVQKKLTAGHGRALLKFEDPAIQCRIAERIVNEGLSVRMAEQMTLSAEPNAATVVVEKTSRSKVTREKNHGVLELEDRLRRVLGTKVALNMNDDRSGEIRIQFFSDAELQRLLERFGA